MKKNSFHEWQNDLDLRQRNVVFPDTAKNEARFWRNLLTSKEPLTKVQLAGLIVLVFAGLGLLIAMLELMVTTIHASPGSLLVRLRPWVIFLVLVACAFVLLRWRVKKAIAGIENKGPSTT